MRIKRSVSRFFAVLVVPAITVAVVAYFGAYAIWGNRGVLALEDTQAQLGIRQQQLNELQASRQRLEHRIALMKPGQVDTVLDHRVPAVDSRRFGPVRPDQIEGRVLVRYWPVRRRP